MLLLVVDKILKYKIPQKLTVRRRSAKMAYTQRRVYRNSRI